MPGIYLFGAGISGEVFRWSPTQPSPTPARRDREGFGAQFISKTKGGLRKVRSGVTCPLNPEHEASPTFSPGEKVTEGVPVH
jgi:hypothetical protein